MGMSLYSNVVYGVRIGSDEGEDGLPKFMLDKDGDQLLDEEECFADLYECMPAWLSADDCKLEIHTAYYYDSCIYYLIVKSSKEGSYDGEEINISKHINKPAHNHWSSILLEGCERLRVEKPDPAWLATCSYF